MNARQLARLGVSKDCVPDAVDAVQRAVKRHSAAKKAGDVQRGERFDPKALVRQVVDNPDAFGGDDVWGDFAAALIEERDFVRSEPISYRTWGEEYIDEASHHQMRQACAMPHAVGAALMPDAHVGYGLPIGGVLALEGAVCPYAVGVDIACRMKLSVLDTPVWSLKDKFEQYRHALETGTRFGVGSKHEKKQQHDVMDRDWNVARVTRENKDKAWKQLGTSGSGNHFVEFGVFDLPANDEELGLDAGQYVALLSHSGSRGVGASVCNTYSAIARSQLPRRYEDLGRLAWLELDSDEGRDYWNAMNLMGEYAAANHAVIHRLVSNLLGAEIVAGVENHHNFAWKETHGGKEVIVHRKGATPAGAGVLGVIPGSMADPAFVVRGKGCAESLNSASHGAGRRMSRKKAKDKFNFRATQKNLKTRGVTVLSAGADEVPGVYKNIREVMAQQTDLVETVGRFDPKIVKMCGDGSRPED